MTASALLPRIYVASLSDYNNGVLHGAWIDLAGKEESVVDVFDCLKHEFKSGPKVVDSLEYYQDTYCAKPL